MVVAVAVTSYAWLQSLPSLTAAEAVQVAADGLAEAGVDGAVVDPHPEATAYAADAGSTGEPAWRTQIAFGEDTIELWVARKGAQPLYLDDRTADGASHLLSDQQFDALAAHRDNPANDRRLRRNLLLTLSALVVAGTAARIASTAPGVVVGRAEPVRGGRDH